MATFRMGHKYTTPLECPLAAVLIRGCRQAKSEPIEATPAQRYYKVGLDFKPVRRKDCRRGKRKPRNTDRWESMSSTFRLLLYVGISVYYYTQQNRACPLVIACDASIIFTAIYHTLNGFELVLQASRNKSQHSQHGNTTTLCLEQLIPDLRNIPEAKIGPLEKHTLLSLRTTEAHLSTPLISLQTRPQAPHKAKARTGRRQTHLTSDGTKWYTKPRLLLRKQGLRPDAKAQFSPATPEGRAEHLPIIKKGIKTNSNGNKTS